MSAMASMLFSAYKWLLLEEWSGFLINCALCTANATNAYSERSIHSSVLGSSIEASAQSAMVLLYQAGDRAASYWPIGCCQSLIVTPA